MWLKCDGNGYLVIVDKDGKEILFRQGTMSYMEFVQAGTSLVLVHIFFLVTF